MKSAFDMTGAKVMVFGAGGGIGRATAQVLATQGARLVLSDREAPEDLAAGLEADGFEAEAYGCDVRSRREIEGLIDAAGPLDALVYLAALCPWDDWSEEGWDDRFDEVLAVNLRGAVFACRAAMPIMKQAGGGRIVLVGSLAGKSGGLIAGAHYVGSKGGLHAIVKWLAQRGGPDGIIVNGVAPASTDTPMMEGRKVDLERIPLRRMSRPDEIAWPIAFLASPAASYVTGTILDVNGGVYMS